jgi:hypothetical protein
MAAKPRATCTREYRTLVREPISATSPLRIAMRIATASDVFTFPRYNHQLLL